MSELGKAVIPPRVVEEPDPAGTRGPLSEGVGIWRYQAGRGETYDIVSGL